MEKTLVFKWTISKGRDTYGYNICSLWVDNYKVASCNGGGYDMEGTVLGDFIFANFSDQLKSLTPNYGSGDNTNGYYGLIFYDPDYKRIHTFQEGVSISLDGACGFTAMGSILNAIGYRLKYIYGSVNKSVYILTNQTNSLEEKE